MYFAKAFVTQDL